MIARRGKKQRDIPSTGLYVATTPNRETGGLTLFPTEHFVSGESVLSSACQSHDRVLYSKEAMTVGDGIQTAEALFVGVEDARNVPLL